MKHSITDLLRCPICGKACSVDELGKTLRCNGPRIHCYDFSRSGYLNLAGPHPGAGDLKSAVRARSFFLEQGYYAPLSDAVNGLLDEIGAKTVLDAGCGEGYYTNRMAKERVVLGVDLSSAGIDHAAKAARRENTNAGFVVASLFTVPVFDEGMDAVTSLFAPCAEEEFSRILKPNGHLIVVAAGERHLHGLKRALYDNPYFNLGRADLPQHMVLCSQKKLTYEISVEGREAIDALFAMTPYYWRTSEHDKAKLDAIESLKTEVDFDIYLYKKGNS